MTYCLLPPPPPLKFFSSRKPVLERYSSKLNQFHKCTDFVPNGRTDPERICQVPYKRKAYPCQFRSGSKWIQSRVNAALDSGGFDQMRSPSLLREVSVRPSVVLADLEEKIVNIAHWPKYFFVKPAEARTVTLKQLIAVFPPVN